MSPIAQAAASEALSLSSSPFMLGTYLATFSFSASTTSTRTVSVAINPPEGAVTTTVALQSFNVYYSDDEQYGYGDLEVSPSVSGTQASCTVTLRDNNTNKREWQASVTALLTFFGK